MIRGKSVILRTVIPEEVDYLYRLITDINRRDPIGTCKSLPEQISG